MVVVKIELWPHGDESQAKPIGRLEISNDMTGDEGLGNYDVIARHSGTFYGKPGVYKSGQVKRFRRSLSPYNLVFKALLACGIR